MRACVRACVCVCMLAHTCARVRTHAFMRDVFAIYDNTIRPRLIMIIIIIIIIYFIKIRHTDDFPSRGTRRPLIVYLFQCQLAGCNVRTYQGIATQRIILLDCKRHV